MASTPLAARRLALFAGKATFNVIAAAFNSASQQMAAMPELRPVVGVFRKIADAANLGRPVIVTALADAATEAHEPPATPPSAEERAAAQRLADELTRLLRLFEHDVGYDVIAITLTRGSDAILAVGEVVIAE